ncbi:MAG: hypothetical protein Q4A01_11245 [Coriobacteriales bacterium]|nr:hypothetical protein [Coriobacteriales bacterium]
MFDIYNDAYQFRLRELTYGATYPIEVSMDEGVEEEIIDRLTSKYESQNGQAPWRLANDDELKECFRLMIASTKSKHILRQLRQG